MTIDLYVDFVSPYAYLAWQRAKTLLPGAEVRPLVILLGPVLGHHGQLGPAEVAPKRLFTTRDTLRRAAEGQIPMVWPPRHPFKPVLAAKAFYGAAEVDRGRVVDALFAAGWGEGGDLESRPFVHAAVAKAGLDADAILTNADAKETSAALRAGTAAAIERGVFGVPTFVDASGELFFGDDQVERIARKLAGNDALDAKARDAVRVVNERPMGVQRAASTNAQMGHRVGTAGVKMEIEDKLAQHVLSIYTRAPFLNLIGPDVVRIGHGETELALTLRGEHKQQDGYAHAAIVALLADHNAGACAATVAPFGSEILTIEFKMNLLRPTMGPRVRTQAKVLRPGRTITVVEAEVFDQRADGKEVLVAKGLFTMAVRGAAGTS